MQRSPGFVGELRSNAQALHVCNAQAWLLLECCGTAVLPAGPRAANGALPGHLPSLELLFIGFCYPPGSLVLDQERS